MQIEMFPHPALATKSVDVTRIDDALRRTVRRMFDMMYEANGVGLAANQVGLPFRFFVINLAARPGQADEEMVFLNPVIRKKKGEELGEEGCLSLPGLYGDVRRAAQVTIEAFDLDGQGFEMTLTELGARAVQHETDHLDGIMFTDRMRDAGESNHVDVQLPKFVEAVRAAQKSGARLSDDVLRQRLKDMIAKGGIPDDFPESPATIIEPPKMKS